MNNINHNEPPLPAITHDHTCILSYLLKASQSEKRTITAIHNKLQYIDKQHLKAMMEHLRKIGYVTIDVDEYLLTKAGRARAEHQNQLAHKLQGKTIINIDSMVGGTINTPPAATAPKSAAPSQPAAKPVSPGQQPAIAQTEVRVLPAPASTSAAPAQDLKLVESLRQIKGMSVSGFHPWRRRYPVPTTPGANVRVARYCIQLVHHPESDPCTIVNEDIFGREGTVMPGTEGLADKDLTTSRLHAQFFIKRTVTGHDQLYIKDLNSTCGTYVNNTRIPPDKLIQVKDDARIRMGNVEIFVTKLTKNDAPSSGKVPPLPKGMEARSGRK